LACPGARVLIAALRRALPHLERFTREARAIAALNHPHIVTVYSTEETEGVRFLTMELVEGQTLDALIPPAGLPIQRFLEIAVPLADALTAAHQKHITHRDLKPANVMLAADGRVKVLDFGLARVAAPAAADQTIEATHALLTQEGTVLGTMPYMAPEQIEGTPADHRSDLFSLGVMFYEMLTGVRPFQGPSSPQLMSSILRDTPPPVCDRRADVPEAVTHLIDRCLEKRPENRVQTARDVYNELRYIQKQLESGPARRPASGSIPAGRHQSLDEPGGSRVPAGPSSGAQRARASATCIAVLPFVARPADEYSAMLGRWARRRDHRRLLAFLITAGGLARLGRTCHRYGVGSLRRWCTARSQVRHTGGCPQGGHPPTGERASGRRRKRSAPVGGELRSPVE
jgi:serine/threonine protein kinase